jgi:hypothetical protein
MIVHHRLPSGTWVNLPISNARVVEESIVLTSFNGVRYFPEKEMTEKEQTIAELQRERDETRRLLEEKTRESESWEKLSHQYEEHAIPPSKDTKGNEEGLVGDVS